MKKLFVSILIFLMASSLDVEAQEKPLDTLANFSASKNGMEWRKYYPLMDEERLVQVLESHPFSRVLNLQKFQEAAETGLFRIEGENLPEYARHEFKAFLYLFKTGGEVRVTVKQILFPDFQENIYWNGMRQADTRGSLEHYILGRNGQIKRNAANERVLRQFDAFFSEIFDPLRY